MVANLNNPHESNLKDVELYENKEKNERTYGVWVFRCGRFQNKGERGFEHWSYIGRFTNEEDGSVAIFTHLNCTDPRYRS